MRLTRQRLESAARPNVIDDFNFKALVSAAKNHALAQGGLNPCKVIAPFFDVDLVRFIEVCCRQRDDQPPRIRFLDQEGKNLALCGIVCGRLLALRQLNPFVLIEIQYLRCRHQAL